MADEGKDAHPRVEDARPIAIETPVNPRLDVETNPLTKNERAATSRIAMSEFTRNRLAVQLRAMYHAVAQQPVPERFADLIAQLDGHERDKP